MIIKIKNHNDAKFDNESHILAVENLLRGFGEGKHIVIAPRSFFKAVISNSNFGNSSKRAAVEAERSQMEYNALLSHVGFYIELDFKGIATTYVWSEFGGREIITVSVDFFVDSRSVQKTAVICENPNDADLYHLIAVYFSKTINPQIRCPIIYDAINGGGGTTKSIFDRKIANKELALCILDNDKSHPKGSTGGTCKSFGDVSHVDTGKVKVINAHEIESLIPLNTIGEVISKHGISREKKVSLDFMGELILNDEQAKFYFDHKKGIDLKSAFTLDAAHGEYWIPLIKKSKYAVDNQCLQENKCNCTPACFKVEGYGENLLTQTIEHIRYGNVNTYTPLLTTQMKEQWIDIGKLFFSWCCAPVKRART